MEDLSIIAGEASCPSVPKKKNIFNHESMMLEREAHQDLIRRLGKSLVAESPGTQTLGERRGWKLQPDSSIMHPVVSDYGDYDGDPHAFFKPMVLVLGSTY